MSEDKLRIDVGDKVDVNTGNIFFSGMIVVYVPKQPGDVWIVKDKYYVLYVDNYNFIRKQHTEGELPF